MMKSLLAVAKWLSLTLSTVEVIPEIYIPSFEPTYQTFIRAYTPFSGLVSIPEDCSKSNPASISDNTEDYKLRYRCSFCVSVDAPRAEPQLYLIPSYVE